MAKYEQKIEVIITGKTEEAVKEAMKKVNIDTYDILSDPDIIGVFNGATKIEKEERLIKPERMDHLQIR